MEILKWFNSEKELPPEGWKGKIKRNGQEAYAHYDGDGNWLIGDEAFGIYGIEWQEKAPDDVTEVEIHNGMWIHINEGLPAYNPNGYIIDGYKQRVSNEKIRTWIEEGFLFHWLNETTDTSSNNDTK
jgi:hypothetical protein